MPFLDTLEEGFFILTKIIMEVNQIAE